VPLKIHISPGQWQSALRKAALAGVSEVELKGWIQEVEFDLQDSPKKKLSEIGFGSDRSHERVLRQKTDRASYSVAWEFEWDKQSDALHLIDFSPMEILK
jgi:hypothetical protein